MILSKWVGFLKSVMRMFIVSRWLTQKTDPEIHHLEKKGVAAAECLWWWLAFEDRIETAIGMIIGGEREGIDWFRIAFSSFFLLESSS